MTCRRPSRYILVEHEEYFVFHIEEATNWEELESEAIVAVRAIGGSSARNDHYPCSKELAARAEYKNVVLGLIFLK